MQHWHEFVMNHLLLFAALLAVLVLLVINLVGDLFAVLPQATDEVARICAEAANG